MLIDPKFYVLADLIRKELPRGKLEDDGANLPKLGAVVAMAGDGDHLDIGTGFGASAIMAAMVKREFKHEGNVYCVDPYSYPPDAPKENLPGAGALNENAVHFGLTDRLVLTPLPSYPIPVDIDNHKFVSAYLDGDKNGMAPWLDFLSARGLAEKFLSFNGFEEFHPGVMVAALRALTVGGWILHWKDGTFLNMRRPVDFSDYMKLPDAEKAKRRQASHV